MAKDKVQTARRNAVQGYPISQLAEEYGMTLVKKRGRRPILQQWSMIPSLSMKMITRIIDIRTAMAVMRSHS